MSPSSPSPSDRLTVAGIIVKTISCKTCGEPTPLLSAGNCTNCLEVEKRLGLYLRSDQGKNYVKKMLSLVANIKVEI